MGLSKSFIKKMEKKLIEKRKEIIDSLVDINNRSSDTDKGIPQDIGDKSMAQYSLHYLSQLSYREFETYKQIQAALEKIEKEDKYGECEMCDSEINPKRIEAIPWAKYCVKCQQKVEKGFF